MKQMKRLPCNLLKKHSVRREKAMSLLVSILLGLGILVGLGLFANAYIRGQQVLKKLSQKKMH